MYICINHLYICILAHIYDSHASNLLMCVCWFRLYNMMRCVIKTKTTKKKLGYRVIVIVFAVRLFLL